MNFDTTEFGEKAKNWFQASAASASEMAASMSEKISSAASTPSGTGVFGMNSSKKDVSGNTAKNDGESKGGDNDISKDDLMQLCMKMNKKLKTLEVKCQEFSSHNQRLLRERIKVLSLIKGYIPIVSNPGDDEDIDLDSIQNSWSNWAKMQEEQLNNLTEQLSLKESTSAHTETLSSDTGKEVSKEEIYKQLKGKVSDLSTRLKQKEMENDNMKNAESILKKSLEEYDQKLQSSKDHFEEKNKENFLKIQKLEEKNMSLNLSMKGFKENETKISNLEQQLKKVSVQLEEKTLSEMNQKEMIMVLQTRLDEVDTQLASVQEEKKSHQNKLSNQKLLKVEQDALTSNLRKDLQKALEELEMANNDVQRLSLEKAKNDPLITKLQKDATEVEELRVKVTDMDALVTRLRSEGEKKDQQHAMRTAMLAGTEQKVQELEKGHDDKDGEIKELKDTINGLERQMDSKTSTLEEMYKEYTNKEDALKKELKELEGKQKKEIKALEVKKDEEIDKQLKEQNRKSAIARNMLSQREEDVRLLTEQVEKMKEEIQSGAPDERRIFALAKVSNFIEQIYVFRSFTVSSLTLSLNYFQ